MPFYFLVFDPVILEQQIRPALTASRRLKSFEPCRSIATLLLPRVRAFRQQCHAGPEEPLIERMLLASFSFDRHLWQSLAGELLLYGAAEIPDLRIAPETLCLLLAGSAEDHLPRELFPPIYQACYGSRDLCFGIHCYGPDRVGYNDEAAVRRLSGYLADQQPEAWKAEDLASLADVADEEERIEELEFARYWYPAFQSLYHNAEQRGQAIVCERI
jgi:hypothetical protein